MEKELYKTIKESDLNIREVASTGTLILDEDDYIKFGFQSRPFNLTAKPSICGHTGKKIVEVKAPYYYYGASKRMLVQKETFYLIE